MSSPKPTVATLASAIVTRACGQILASPTRSLPSSRGRRTSSARAAAVSTCVDCGALRDLQEVTADQFSQAILDLDPEHPGTDHVTRRGNHRAHGVAASLPANPLPLGVDRYLCRVPGTVLQRLPGTGEQLHHGPRAVFRPGGSS